MNYQPGQNIGNYRVIRALGQGGMGADEARINELNRSGVNYFNVCPKVNADAVDRKEVL